MINNIMINNKMINNKINIYIYDLYGNNSYYKIMNKLLDKKIYNIELNDLTIKSSNSNSNSNSVIKSKLPLTHQQQLPIVLIFGSLYKNKKLQSKIFTIKKELINIVHDKKEIITLKDNLFKTLGDKPYYLKQYNININNITNLNSFLKYKKLFNNKVWIYKPVSGFKGFGIKIFDNYKNFLKYNKTQIILNKRKEYKTLKKNINQNIKSSNTQYNKNIKTTKYRWVLQEYINNPLLVDGKKFHIRTHLLYSYIDNKEELYYYQKGDILTAKSLYKKGDYYNKNIHDTHYIPTDKIRIYPDYFKFTKEQQYNINIQIKQIYKDVKKHLHPKCYNDSKNCYEIFGVDLMIDVNHKVYLIEINSKIGIIFNNNYNNKMMLRDAYELTLMKLYEKDKKVSINNMFKKISLSDL
jgi:hypothetical protein